MAAPPGPVGSVLRGDDAGHHVRLDALDLWPPEDRDGRPQHVGIIGRAHQHRPGVPVADALEDGR